MATGVQVTFDCADPGALSRFWADALNYIAQPPPEGYDSWETWAVELGIPEENWNDQSACIDPDGGGPRLFFQKVPEPKFVKNRVHLDVNVGKQVESQQRDAHVDAEVERIVALGATKVETISEWGERHVVMRDPEGNEFCLQ